MKIAKIKGGYGRKIALHRKEADEHNTKYEELSMKTTQNMKKILMKTTQKEE